MAQLIVVILRSAAQFVVLGHHVGVAAVDRAAGLAQGVDRPGHQAVRACVKAGDLPQRVGHRGEAPLGVVDQGVVVDAPVAPGAYAASPSPLGRVVVGEVEAQAHPVGLLHQQVVLVAVVVAAAPGVGGLHQVPQGIVPVAHQVHPAPPVVG